MTTCRVLYLSDSPEGTQLFLNKDYCVVTKSTLFNKVYFELNFSQLCIISIKVYFEVNFVETKLNLPVREIYRMSKYRSPDDDVSRIQSHV